VCSFKLHNVEKVLEQQAQLNNFFNFSLVAALQTIRVSGASGNN
jgi:hypothetical protein